MRPGLRICLNIAIVLAVVAPPASGSSAWHAELEVASIRVGPSSQIEAPLSVFVSEWTIGAATLIPHEFRLTAQQVRVEVDQMEARIHTGQSFHGLAGNTTVDEFDEATGRGLENRPGYRIMVLPDRAADVQLRSDCGELAPSTEDTVQRNARAASAAVRPPVDVSVARANEWQDCGSKASLGVTGSFVVALWEWDFEIQDTEGEHVFQTGQGTHPALTGLPDVSSTISKDQEAWVYVQNGSLSLSLIAGAQHTLYTATTATMQSSSGFLFQDATGPLGIHGQEAAGNRVHMQGRLGLEVLEGPRESLATYVEGELTELTVDENTVWQASQVSSNPAGGLSGPVVVLGLLAVLLFVTLPQAYYRSLQAAEARKVRGLPGSTWRQRQASAFTVMARNAYHRGHPRSALALSRVALWFHVHPQTHITRANAHGDLGHVKRLHLIHRHLDKSLNASRERCRNAWNAYQAIRSTDAELAFSWYQRARASDLREFRALAAGPDAA